MNVPTGTAADDFDPDARPAVVGAAAPPAPGAEGAAAPLPAMPRASPPLVIEGRAPIRSIGSVASYAVTLAVWSLWVYFLMPLVTLLLWTLGWLRFSSKLLTPDAVLLLERRLPAYVAVVGLLCGGLVLWALASWWRFGQRERRKSAPGVSTQAVARRLGLDPVDLARWQTARRLVVHHDGEGRPCGFEEGGAPPP